MAFLSSLFYLLAFCASLLIPTSCIDHPRLPKKHVAFFIFGDSLFDAGNNKYLNITGGNENVWPYGETFFKHPTGRVCDGRVVPDFIAEHAKLLLIPPYLQPGLDNFTDGVNFASGGAGVLVETHPGTINLKMQLSYFETVEKRLRQQLGDAEAKKLLSRAVYLFSIGGNDYISIIMSSSSNQSNVVQSYYKRKYIGMVLGNFTTVIKEIYGKGGRKFGFQNVGPLGCMPATKASTSGGTVDCVKEPSTIAKLHNIALRNVLKKLERQLPGFKYSFFDYYTSLAQRTLYASKYGFKEGKSACCGSGAYKGIFSCGSGTTKYELCSNPSEYVWFDAGHPTESANRQLADLLWSGHPNVTGPYNLKMLFEML